MIEELFFLNLSKTEQMIKTFFKTFVLTVMVAFSNHGIAQETTQTNSQRFAEILTYVDQIYVDKVDDHKLTDHAIRSLLEELDPHSSYISKEDVNDANETINGSFVGIGIRFQIFKDTLQVVQTIAGGPSERVGLMAGDRIVTIADVNVAGIGLKNNEVREKLLGEKGTKVKVEIKRNGSSKNIFFTITRDKIPVYSVDAYYMVRPEIGYVKLNSFSRTSLEEIREGIISLREQGMKYLIVDLQDNGGGLLYTAQNLLAIWLLATK